MIHINKRISIVFALCLAKTFSMQDGVGLASSPAVSPLPEATTNSVDPITPMVNSTPLPLPTETQVDAQREPSQERRVLFAEGVATEESPSRPSSRSPSKRSSKEYPASFSTAFQCIGHNRSYSLNGLGLSRSLGHGDTHNIPVTVDKFVELSKLSQDAVSQFCGAVFTALAGGSGIIWLEQLGSCQNLAQIHNGYYSTNAVAYFVKQSDAKQNMLFLLSVPFMAFGEKYALCKSGFMDFIKQLLDDEKSLDDDPKVLKSVFTGALAAKLALAKFLSTRDNIPLDITNAQMAFIPKFMEENLIIRDNGKQPKPKFYIVLNNKITVIDSTKSLDYKEVTENWTSNCEKNFFLIRNVNGNEQVYHQNQLILDHNPFARAVSMDEHLTMDEHLSLTVHQAMSHTLSLGNTVLIRPNATYIVMTPQQRFDKVKAEYAYQQDGSNQKFPVHHPEVLYKSYTMQVEELIGKLEMKALSRSASNASLNSNSSAAGDKA